MEQPKTPERLKELIDEALDEIERTELEMLDLLSDVLGPSEAKRVADQIAAQSEAPRFKRLLGEGGTRAVPGDDQHDINEGSREA